MRFCWRLDVVVRRLKLVTTNELPQDIGWLTPAGFIKKPLKRDPLIDVDWLTWLMMKSNAVAGLVALNAKKSYVVEIFSLILLTVR